MSWIDNSKNMAKKKKIICVVNNDTIEAIRKVDPDFKPEHIRSFVRNYTDGQSEWFNRRLREDIRKDIRKGLLTLQTVRKYKKEAK